jgi:methyl-accepting chemotaxis protein
MSNSKSFISSWIFVQSDNTNSEKIKLNKLVDTEYPQAKEELLKLSAFWSANDKASLDSVFLEIDGLFVEYKKVKNVLSTFESYNDPMLIFEVTPMMQDQGSISLKFNQIIRDLDKITVTQVKNSQTAISNMTTLLNRFKFFIILIAIGTVILGVFTTINTVRGLIKPITEVKEALVKMGNGEISENKLIVGKDELGEMSAALNYLSDGLKDTAAYADKIGNGDFNASFKPLSDNDLLGNSLLEMGKKLKVLGEEDRKRNWVTAGLAKFADILRSSSEVSELSDEIISNIVKYLGANQGGIFLLKEEGSETVLELTA